MKHIPVIVFGAGGVGRALLRQIVSGRQNVATRAKCRFDVVAVADSRSWLWGAEGLSDEQLTGVVATKEAGNQLGQERPSGLELLAQVEATAIGPGLVVDVTAADGMEPVIDRALEMGHGVVLANKKPLAAPWETARHYFGRSRLRHESTVGGGQPVIATLNYLRDTDDHIYSIEGQLSGTLGYICGRLDGGTPFSQALAEARESGFTEADPREDLGGLDVKRKMLILARLAGWPLEDGDISIEALYYPALAHLSVTEFMQAAVAMNPSFRDRVDAAAAKGQVLRYAAKVTAEGGSVGLKPLPKTSPLANLKYISFRTGRYSDEPLLIGGKGAGVEMTAAGVLGDMIRVAGG